MASHSNPTVDISQDGEKFHIKLHSLFVTRESTFTVGDEYEETQHNGTVMKVKPCWEDEKLVLTYEPKVEGTATSQKHTRELDSEGNEMTLTLEVGGVVAKRFFKRTS
ncbi:hypothetical protein LSAT2_006530 [Lamellibrachia satsuma]|nr:hypothetical protein LSAT2_006530 [Lamellibrachia satsuma]